MRGWSESVCLVPCSTPKWMHSEVITGVLPFVLLFLHPPSCHMIVQQHLRGFLSSSVL